jgi:hypothetical protein
MSDHRPVEFANFICRTDRLELLDFVDTVVVPAFQLGLARTWGESTYFLHDVQIVDLEPETRKGLLAVAGRFVKDTVLHSEQVFRNGALTANNQKIKSAPSAFFLLLIEQHKLIYCSEYKGAPSLETFRSTLQQFINRAHANYIQSVYEQSKASASEQASVPSERVTKVSLLAEFPRPTLEIVPLASQESIAEFIARFKTLQALTIRLIKPNNEINNEGFFQALRGSSEKLGSSASTLTYRNAQGLSKQTAVGHAEAAADGNAELKFAGKDQTGQQLSGSNEDFRVVRFIQGLPSKTVAAAKRLLQEFLGARASGLIAGEPAAADGQELRLANVRQQAVSDDD